MRVISNCFLLSLAFTSNVHAIVLGTDDVHNTYSSVGYTLTTGGEFGSVVALDPHWVLTATHVVDSAPALMVMGGAPGDSGGAMWLDYGEGEIVAGINSFIFDENVLLNPPETPDWTDGYWTVGTSTAYYQDWITSHVPTARFGGSPVPIPPAV
jgi:hypothetical protein